MTVAWNPFNPLAGAQEFTLTGHAGKGWVLGEVRANDIISLWQDDGPPVKPVIEVSKGDQVVLKLRSADVTHGFSLKAYGIYVAQGHSTGQDGVCVVYGRQSRPVYFHVHGLLW